MIPTGNDVICLCCKKENFIPYSDSHVFCDNCGLPLYAALIKVIEGKKRKNIKVVEKYEFTNCKLNNNIMY